MGVGSHTTLIRPQCNSAPAIVSVTLGPVPTPEYPKSAAGCRIPENHDNGWVNGRGEVVGRVDIKTLRVFHP